MKLEPILQAVLLASDEPLSLDQLGQAFMDHERPGRAELRNALEALAESQASSGVRLLETGGGWRFVTAPEFTAYVARMRQEPPRRYSRALLETLALIAYRQPITRGEIENVRGVSVSSGIIRTIEERGWVRVVGHKDVPGRPALWATTRQFLDHFCLKSLNELPPIDAIEAHLGDLLDDTTEPHDGTNS